MELQLTKWDSTDYLQSTEDIALYLEAVIEEAGNDSTFIVKAIGNIARARGMTQLAKETGLGRESLYKTLSGETKPSFDTILKIMKTFGLQLSVKAVPISCASVST
ncbi:putative addiction module antidote protein [Oxalobacteraceae bacterium]|nr:putative addiction module antidote protein [Oxalobacteraceae bacterium]NRR29626.1 putative addiction module antidote protein [Oxalobacteraceae bacterium]